MTRGDCDSVKIAPRDWLKLIVALAGHALLLFSALLYWTNRLVAVEVKVATIERTVADGLSEVRSDIKELLKRSRGKTN